MDLNLGIQSRIVGYFSGGFWVKALAVVFLMFGVFGQGFAGEVPREATQYKRVALVIGNSKYPGVSLRNPANDAHDMAVVLRKTGFDVIEKIDVTQKEMNRAIVQFGGMLNADTVALFYYAGHGMQVKGKNYLIPIDAQIDTENSVRAETVDVDTILDQLNASPLNIVVLDACRNNPFERRFRSLGGGLAQMDAPKGTLIAYATAPGKVASDGEGRNGLYTQELLKVLQTPGLEVEKAFKRVRANVARATGDNQIPWEASSLTGEFMFSADAVTQREAEQHQRETLQKALKAQQEENERKLADALKQVNEKTAKDQEQSQREKAELQRALKTQQDASERAVAEALRKAEEKANRERAELQQSMEKMIKEMLARQNSGDVAQSPARPAVTQGKSVDAALPAQPARIASVQPSSSVVPALSTAMPEAGKSFAATGEEWEYKVEDRTFGSSQVLVQRVVGGVPGTGVIEQYSLNGRFLGEWAFAGKPVVTGLPTTSEVLFGPHWNGDKDATVSILGLSRCAAARCQARISSMGVEEIVVPAGKFNTGKYEVIIDFVGTSPMDIGTVVLNVWYSAEHQRLIRQTAKAYGFRNAYRSDEFVELVAIRGVRP